MDATMTRVAAQGSSWGRQAEALGFADRDGVYRLDGVCLRMERGWPTLTTVRTEARGDPLRGRLGRPGLWKSVVVGAGRRASVQQVWELPPAVLRDLAEDADEEQGDGDGSAFHAALAWALATADGQAPAGWRAPPREELEAAMPPGALTVRKGSLVRQGSLLWAPNRVALVFPVLARVPPDLPGARREWLEALLADAQTQWRLVRLGVAAEEGASSVQAEVDLSGAPLPLMEGLLKNSLSALQWVVQWLIRSADFLADARVACRALGSA
jgi:hypothetical protein